jgi:hypothetical protein
LGTPRPWANTDYDSVVLHVFTQRSGPDFFTRTAQHREVPQVLLDLTRLADDPPNPQPEAKPGAASRRCARCRRRRCARSCSAPRNIACAARPPRSRGLREAHGTGRSPVPGARRHARLP